MSEKQKILIVDDTPDNVQLLGNILKDQYELSVALSGEEALRIVEKSPFDLVLLDIMMPGIDGFEVCRRIRRKPQFNTVPVLFLTAKNDRDSVVLSSKAGAQDFIVKPFDKRTILDKVSLHLKQGVSQNVQRGGGSHGMQSSKFALSAAVSAVKGMAAQRFDAAVRHVASLENHATTLEAKVETVRDLLERTTATAKATLALGGGGQGTLQLAVKELDAAVRTFDAGTGLAGGVLELAKQTQKTVKIIRGLEEGFLDSDWNEKVSFNLGRVLAKQVERSKGQGIEMVSALYDDRDILGSKSLISAIFEQLLMNSLQVPYEKGVSPLVRISTSVDGGEVRWTWEDNGLGPVSLDKVAGEFYTTREGHAGVGVPVVKGWLKDGFGASMSLSVNSEGGLRILMTFPSEG
ncbi:MAG: response regulator [Spirochaetales bacterium]|nr:response regulator [Spirochaetales bacterium]